MPEFNRETRALPRLLQRKTQLNERPDQPVLDQVQGYPFPDHRDSFVRIANHRHAELASGNHARDCDLVLLSILLFRFLRYRTLHRSGIPLFGALVVLWLFNFETAALGFGLCFFFRGRSPLLSEVEFHSKIPAVAPAQVKLKSASLIIHKGKPQAFVFADRPIPAAVRFRIFIGKSANAPKWFITDADNVVVEVMKWIAHVPHEFAATFALSIPGRRHRIIRIFEPPDRVPL